MQPDRRGRAPAGAWIETADSGTLRLAERRAPHGARGLKLSCSDAAMALRVVAPHAGAWIETAIVATRQPATAVAPHAGAWIETACESCDVTKPLAVAPHTGAWIETSTRGLVSSR